MDKRVLLIRRALEKAKGLIEPQSDIHSPLGHRYPLACETLELEPPEEVPYLEALAERGLLERQWVDKIHLCPFCHHYAINFREVCPNCDSSNIHLVEMLHHFRCGHVAPEHEFQKGIRYLCPKCNKALRHIGVDYEKPNTQFICKRCGHLFTDPKVSCLSLKCNRSFEAEAAEIRPLFAYRVTGSGRIVADTGVISEDGLGGGFVDAQFAVYTPHYLREQIDHELRRSRRYKGALSLIMACPDISEEQTEVLGPEGTSALFKNIATIIKESLRSCDIPALFREDVLAILLPETPPEGAVVAAERIRERIQDLNQPELPFSLSISLGVAGLEQWMESADDLLGAAGRNLEQAREAGGNRVCAGQSK